MKLESFLDVPDRPRFYGLLFVMLLELLALGPLENYVNRPETLTPTAVTCRHATAIDGTIYSYGWGAGVTVTNYTNIYFYGPKQP